MRCPSCQGRQLRIEVTFTGMIDCDFQADGTFEVKRPVSLESAWEPDSECVCLSCDWQGTMADLEQNSSTEHSERGEFIQ